VGDALVHAQLDALGIDQDHANLFGVDLKRTDMFMALMATDLPER